MKLFNLNYDKLKRSTTNLYDDLKGGLYFLKVEGIKNEIRIKLK